MQIFRAGLESRENNVQGGKQKKQTDVWEDSQLKDIEKSRSAKVYTSVVHGNDDFWTLNSRAPC